jgi:hypothetical protein
VFDLRVTHSILADELVSVRIAAFHCGAPDQYLTQRHNEGVKVAFPAHARHGAERRKADVTSQHIEPAEAPVNQSL